MKVIDIKKKMLFEIVKRIFKKTPYPPSHRNAHEVGWRAR